jgi:CHAD domain-containing protein
MKSTRRELQEPVELVCQQYAAAMLSVAAEECKRLGKKDDSEALHDFRVSVRRLRTYLEAYDPYAPKGLGKKTRKRLGAITAATNKGRDDQVHAEWLSLQLQKSNLPKLTRQGYRIALDELNESGTGPNPEWLSNIVNDFTSLEGKLKGRLADPPLSIHLNQRGESVDYGAATGEIVRRLAGALQERLEAIESLDQKKRIHRARLAAKRLRYVLEPVKGIVTGGRPVVRQLKEAQDRMGDLRDLQILEARVRSTLEHEASRWSRELAESASAEASLSAVQKRIGQTQEFRAMAAAVHGIRRAETRLYAGLAKRWLKGSAEPFFQQVNRIVLQLLPVAELARPPATAP